MRATLALALVLTGAASTAEAAPFCDALDRIVPGAAFGFATVRGAADPAAHTSSFDIYRAKVSLPGGGACGVTVPHSRGLGPPSYSCEFPGGLDVERAMSRLVRKTARCVGVGVGNPPRLKTGPAGPSFDFYNGTARFDLTAAREGGKGAWTITLAVTRSPRGPRRPKV